MISEYRIDSVNNALRLLRVLAEDRRPRGVSELSRMLGFNKASVFRLLATLAGQGFVRQDPDTRAYGLGSELVVLGRAASESLHFRRDARALMEQLTAETVMHPFLTLPAPAHVVTLEHLPITPLLALFGWVRHTIPYHSCPPGLVLVPADRVEALLPQRSVHENIALPLYNRIDEWGPINVPHEGNVVRDAVRRLQIDTRAQRQVRRLSGGNQQKVTIARWLATGFRVLLLFDPTRGIDVGTRRQIHTFLRQLAADGVGVLFFTSELPEVQLVCDRVLVLYEGKVVREMPAPQAAAGP